MRAHAHRTRSLQYISVTQLVIAILANLSGSFAFSIAAIVLMLWAYYRRVRWRFLCGER